jgi:hypothetical protein
LKIFSSGDARLMGRPGASFVRAVAVLISRWLLIRWGRHGATVGLLRISLPKLIVGFGRPTGATYSDPTRLALIGRRDVRGLLPAGVGRQGRITARGGLGRVVRGGRRFVNGHGVPLLCLSGSQSSSRSRRRHGFRVIMGLLLRIHRRSLRGVRLAGRSVHRSSGRLVRTGIACTHLAPLGLRLLA